MVFYNLFREEGISDKYRGSVWCNLLDIEELKNDHRPTFFAKLIEIPNETLDTAITKDHICDRSGIFIDFKSREIYKPDQKKMRNVLLAYGNIDCELFYN
jgi:hypothetical protein